MSKVIDEFFQSIQRQALPGIWSRGVALARENSVYEDRREAGEIHLRVKVTNRPVSPQVTLWPEEDDAYCDCGDRVEPCLHVVAAVVALKNDLLKKPDESAGHEGQARQNGQIIYTWVTRAGRALPRLLLERAIVQRGAPVPLTGSLVGYLGGITSGRIAGALPAATRADFAMDRLLSEAGGTQAPDSISFLKAAQGLSETRRAEVRMKISTTPIRHSARLMRVPGGLRIESQAGGNGMEIFENGIACQGDTLCPYEVPRLSTTTLAFLEGRLIEEKALPRFVSETLPELRQELALDVSEARLPESVRVRPRIALKQESLGEDRLVVTAVIVYAEPGGPRLGQVRGGELLLEHPGKVPIRDAAILALEAALAKSLKSELHLQLDQPTRFEGMEAVRFLRLAAGWENLGEPAEKPVGGTSRPSPRLLGELIPQLSLDPKGRFQLQFRSSTGSHDVGVTADAVWAAWGDGRAYVPVTEGAWGELPRDWLERYGKTIQDLLAAQTANGERLPPYLIPALLDIGEVDGEAQTLARIREFTKDFTQIPAAALPAGVSATLRDYQKAGVAWLQFLRRHEMGGLLADDMGLGKTLQAICAMPEGGGARTLVVAPTSVLHGWREQLRKFRPSLAPNLFHGAGRAIEGGDVMLTSFGTLRAEADRLAGEAWDMIVIDESQIIRNPQSQTFQAVKKLRAPFRLALSGTPIENRFSDLWAQFEFINPGLLPREFGESDVESTRRRIRPFFLRRTKEDVTRELPSKTELTLSLELSAPEREKYQAVLAATRAEVVAQLASGHSAGGLFGALEALLRLRQACCHPRLLPGMTEADASSAKAELLWERLHEAVAAGHKALVFSQWTSFLDLLEPGLLERDIPFLRLDGATANREEIVQGFQRPDGPPVLLLSLKAGGVGLTLTEADYVFLMDPWWNPAVERQAADRAHRIGQSRPVIIHKLIARDTIEEKILALQASKQQLAEDLLTFGDTALTRDDLLALLT
ncbi:MAG: SNF2-related protein [Bacteriovoracia bacterium]